MADLLQMNEERFRLRSELAEANAEIERLNGLLAQAESFAKDQQDQCALAQQQERGESMLAGELARVSQAWDAMRAAVADTMTPDLALAAIDLYDPFPRESDRSE